MAMRNHVAKKLGLPFLAVIICFGAMFVGAQQSTIRENQKKTSDKVEKSDAEWKSQLTPEQYEVTRKKGTERAFAGAHWNNKHVGIYRCVCCDEPLFDSQTKFESGTGWPSFYDVVSKNSIAEVADNGFFARRTEVICRRCDAHLGHVFDDGPQDKTGLRYCVNSAALKFEERKPDPPAESVE
jgi:peptide-methionine (R)-S-oxide reductase